MTAAGVLLDTGPLVALMAKSDHRHAEAKRAFAECAPPLRCCEAVVAEACFLLSQLRADAPAEVLALARAGLFTVGLAAADHWAALEALMRRYREVPMSFADACLVRCAEVHREARILTFDRHFTIYRWARTQRFQNLVPED